MSVLFSSPSFHQRSSLARSRSATRRDSTSSITSQPSYTMRRSGSYSAPRSGGFTLPSYGYGGGYMSRSLSRSTSSLFGRSLSATALSHTAPLHNVGVQRSTPHYTDKYPYVRYSYGNTDSAAAVMAQTDLTAKNYPSIKDAGTRRWLEGKLNSYNPGLFSRYSHNYFESRPEKPITPMRNYVRYMPVDDAVDMYKKNCMTVGTLSKYWLSPTTSQSRRDRDLNLNPKSYGVYSMGSKYDKSRPTYYSRVASILNSGYY
ncbi:hypothetical protein FO519_007272 [Halicephalobus sp. NKZ332]|nr:hypothetical protein FO519_007272 [Halicephalobus sp. NKZ332]